MGGNGNYFSGINGNWTENRWLAGVGTEMGLKLVGMGRIGEAESHSRTPLIHA